MKWKSLVPVLALCLIGCNQSSQAPEVASGGGKIIIAKLDSLPILQQDPAYQELAQKYTTEQIRLRQDMEKQLHEGKLSPATARPAYLKAQAALNQKWMKNTNDFIQNRHTKMRDAVKQLCEEKHIDMVLIDSKAYHTVAYGGFDITQDVLMKIYGNPLGPAATPQGAH